MVADIERLPFSKSLYPPLVADVYIKVSFKNSYFCKEYFVLTAFDHYKISKKQNQQSVYCGDLFIYSVTDLSWFLVFL